MCVLKVRCRLQTSSPSYLLMASLDAARHQAVQQSTWAEPARAAQRIRDGLAKLPGISVLDRNNCACAGMPLGTLPCQQWLLRAPVLSPLTRLTSACLTVRGIANTSSPFISHLC